MPRKANILARIPKPAASWSRLFGMGILVGLLGGLAAAGLEWALHEGVKHLVGQFTHVAGEDIGRFHLGVLLLPAAGGLVSGLVVWWFCPTAFGHGTDALTRAFHHNMGKFPLKGPAIKGAAAAGVISCGGSAGPEGPIAALGAAIGSTMGSLFGMTPRERRVLLVAGCAAGVGAIFQCPLGGALFAAGVLYKEPEFETDAIVPAFVASVIGYSTFMAFYGFGEFLLPHASTLAFTTVWHLVPYLVLGPLCGLVSILLSLCMWTVEKKLLPWSRLPRWFAPAIGGLATGGLACVLPQVMDGQYDFIRNAMSAPGNPTAFVYTEHDWWTWAGLFGAVAVVKCIATALTVGSGASGGVLGPSVFVGGAVGAFLGAAMEALYPGQVPDELRLALIPVGMGGVLAASMRVPLASIVMVMEMTGSYGLIVPLMLVCMTSYVVGRRFGLNHEQLRSAAESPAHAADAVIHILEANRVEQIMERDWPLVATRDMSMSQLVERIQPGTRPVFAVVDDSKLSGLISVPDLEGIMAEPGLADALIADDIMTEELATVFADDDLYSALNVFRIENHDVLPVVSRDRRRRWVGMLTRERVFEAVRQRVQETQQAVMKEHAGLAAIEQEGQLQQLVMGVNPMRTDQIQRLIVPMQALGKSLRDADFRRNFGAQVIAIEKPDGSIQCPPDIDAPLTMSDRLVAVVWQNDAQSGATTEHADATPDGELPNQP